ncbi:hypothetical protein IJZ97_04540, partial [bacterium]|nr:hypothetical protein [bacterium]
HVPLIIYGKNVRPQNLGTREGFSDIAKTVCDYWSVDADIKGESFIKEILNSAVNKITRKKGMKILCGLNIFRSVSFWRFGVLIYKYFYANIPSRGINYENRDY